jgi:hypothetical protein
MKALQVVTIIVTLTLVLLTSLQAQAMDVTRNDSTVVAEQVNNDQLFEQFEASLIYGFSSDVLGVVESSIYNAVNFKIAYPDFNSEKVLEDLNRVAIEGSNHSIRYRAYLALAYYKNQSEFKNPDSLLSLLDHQYQDGIFFYLQETIRGDQFTSNM